MATYGQNSSLDFHPMLRNAAEAISGFMFRRSRSLPFAECKGRIFPIGIAGFDNHDPND